MRGSFHYRDPSASAHCKRASWLSLSLGNLFCSTFQMNWLLLLGKWFLMKNQNRKYIHFTQQKISLPFWWGFCEKEIERAGSKTPSKNWSCLVHHFMTDWWGKETALLIVLPFQKITVDGSCRFWKAHNRFGPMAKKQRGIFRTACVSSFWLSKVILYGSELIARRRNKEWCFWIVVLGRLTEVLRTLGSTKSKS